MNNKNDIWILIPARKGSKSIPRKNLRFLGNKPLILHVLDQMLQSFDVSQIIVSTDSSEIASVVESKARIHQRSEQDAADAATLDQVAVSVCRWLLTEGAHEDDYLFTVQPTSPFIRTTTILKGKDKLNMGAGSIISVKDDRHLRWTIDEKTGRTKPLFTKRLNRQYLSPTLVETGGLIGARIGDIIRNSTRIIEPVELIEIDQEEGLDIDTYADWAIAEYYVQHRQIIIRADGGPSLGMGHVYRALALAHEFSSHGVTLVSRKDEGYRLGADFLSDTPYRKEVIERESQFIDILESRKPDIVILDVLDTTTEYVQEVKTNAGFVVSFEDLGPGSQLADVVVNDLYTDFYPHKNHFYGVQNAILAQTFEAVGPTENPEKILTNVLVTFGGTDPQNLTYKVVKALQMIDFQGQVTVVVGPGYSHEEIDLSNFQLRGKVLNSVENMAILMREAGMAITSAGRTVTELMSLGVPTIVMCQNLGEMRHTHASSPFGVINLGLGEYLNIDAIAQNIKMLMDNYEIRLDMRNRALRSIAGRSNREICQRLLAIASEKLMPNANNIGEK